MCGPRLDTSSLEGYHKTDLNPCNFFQTPLLSPLVCGQIEFPCLDTYGCVRETRCQAMISRIPSDLYATCICQSELLHGTGFEPWALGEDRRGGNAIRADMAGPHTSGAKGTGSVVTIDHGDGMGLDPEPPSKIRRTIVGSVLLTLGALTIVGGVTLAWWSIPFLAIGDLLAIFGLNESGKGGLRLASS